MITLLVYLPTHLQVYVYSSFSAFSAFFAPPSLDHPPYVMKRLDEDFPWNDRYFVLLSNCEKSRKLRTHACQAQRQQIRNFITVWASSAYTTIFFGLSVFAPLVGPRRVIYYLLYIYSGLKSKINSYQQVIVKAGTQLECFSNARARKETIIVAQPSCFAWSIQRLGATERRELLLSGCSYMQKKHRLTCNVYKPISKPASQIRLDGFDDSSIPFLLWILFTGFAHREGEKKISCLLQRIWRVKVCKSNGWCLTYHSRDQQRRQNFIALLTHSTFIVCS